MLYDPVVMKNNKLRILQPFKKSVHKKSHLIRSFMAFKPNELVMAMTMA
jgi:hypothetical protein